LFRCETTRAWWKVSLQTFGGPAGQIAVMHREFVDERRWIGERRFLHALSYCTLLPGPEAQQLAIYLGWLLNGTPGGLIAGSLFVLPGYLAILGLSAIYARFGDTLVITALFTGVASAVLAIVSQAVVRVGKRALINPFLVALAVGSFVALAGFDVPFPDCDHRRGYRWLVGKYLASRVADDALHGEPPSGRRAAKILLIGLILWVTPVLIAAATAGSDSVFVTQGKFFGLTTLVTFGGAYAGPTRCLPSSPNAPSRSGSTFPSGPRSVPAPQRSPRSASCSSSSSAGPP
jgi:chromate transporter